MGNQLAIGNITQSAALNDDTVFNPDTDEKFVTNTPTQYLTSQGVSNDVVIDPPGMEEGGPQPLSDDLVIDPPGMEERGIGVGGTMGISGGIAVSPSNREPDTSDDSQYQWWSMAKLLTYNLEYALKGRYQSSSARGLMDGLSLIKSLGSIVEGIGGIFGSGDAQAGGTGDSTGYQDGTGSTGTNATGGQQYGTVTGLRGLPFGGVTIAQLQKYRVPLNGRSVNTESGSFWVQRPTHKHKGLDISGPTQGSWGVTGHDGPAFAAMQGVVWKTETGFTHGKDENNGKGNAVYINSGNLTFVYFHLDSVTVKKDQLVQVGERIGIIGNTGSSSAVHLHFEIRQKDNQSAWYDPLPWLVDGSLVDLKKL